MTLNALARASGESIHAVRYYARLGLVTPAAVAANGYRFFDPSALVRLSFIRRAQRLGFTLDEVGSFVADAERGRSPCPRVRRLLDERLPEVAAQLEEAAGLLQRMQQAQRRWKRRPDTAPTGRDICRLIESERAA